MEHLSTQIEEIEEQYNDRLAKHKKKREV